MALGLGEGGEQNAPLGRAVIGGLGGGWSDNNLPFQQGEGENPDVTDRHR